MFEPEAFLFCMLSLFVGFLLGLLPQSKADMQIRLTAHSKLSIGVNETVIGCLVALR